MIAADDPPSAEPDKRPIGTDIRGAGAAPQPDAGRGEVGAANAGAKRDDEDDEDVWRHEPVAPVNEPNPLRSLGTAVSETVTGSDQDRATPRKR